MIQDAILSKAGRKSWWHLPFISDVCRRDVFYYGTNFLLERIKAAEKGYYFIITSYTIHDCCSAVWSADAQTGGLRFQSTALWTLYFHLIYIRTEAWTGWPAQTNSLLSFTRMRLLMVCTTNTAWLGSCPSEIYFFQLDEAPNLTVPMLKRGLYASQQPMCSLEGRVRRSKRTHPGGLSAHGLPCSCCPFIWGVFHLPCPGRELGYMLATACIFTHGALKEGLEYGILRHATSCPSFSFKPAFLFFVCFSAEGRVLC